VIKQAPTPGRILAMVVFTLSCFAILLSLWLQFGGPIPLRPQGYQVQVAFPEGTGLTKNIEVRAAGIPVGAVVDVDVDRAAGRALATIELESEYAPLASDARAILRRKTLLGETFVEIATGTASAPKLPDGGRLDDARVAKTVELDEMLQTYDPTTRRAFRIWQQELGTALGDRGESLNNALGQLPDFTRRGADLLAVLDEQETAVRGLVRDTGEVYSALSQDEGQLRALIENSHGVFSQTAAQRDSLAEAFRIFPVFLGESKATLERLEVFSRDTRPLVRDLRPVARELRPTVRSVRALAPDLKRFFQSFDQQITASRRGLPALREVIDETRPLFGSMGPFLSELNPIFQWLEVHQHLVADFLSYGASGLSDTTPSRPDGEVGHYLRQLGVQGLESIGIHRNRLSSNRGNSYLPPIYTGRETSRRLIQPNWDCNPSGGEVDAKPAPVGATVACFTQPNMIFKGKPQGRFPHVERESYRR
jgi:phospholipid/cholesterol/gamma-HCH transport system substrate-binding protein